MSRLTPEHAFEIGICEDYGFDTTILRRMGKINPAFKVDELKEIRLAIQAGLPVDEFLELNEEGYAVYSAKHMEQMRLGLLHGVDISYYTGYNIVYWPIHPPKRMEQIRLGLEQGLDVTVYNNWDSSYNRPVYSAEQCKAIREMLLYQREHQERVYPAVAEIVNPSMSPQDILNITRRWEVLRIREEKLARGELPDIDYYKELGTYSYKELSVINEGLKMNIDFTPLLPIIKTASKRITAIFTYCFINNVDYSAINVRDPYGFFIYNDVQMSNYLKDGNTNSLILTEWGYPSQ